MIGKGGARLAREKSSKPNQSKASRPDIFQFHDYRTFLRDWFAFLKATRPGFSRRTLSAQAQLATSYLPMILSGTRELSLKILSKLAPHLHLSRTELSYLEKLVQLGTYENFEGKLVALDRMSRHASYQKRNPNEAEFFELMRNWYYVAIQQMANLEGFRADPEWIQEKLNFKVPLPELKAALSFLLEKGYLQQDEKGVFIPPKETLTCQGEVFTAALTQFHKQMFTLASQSIEMSTPQERTVQGFTLAISAKRYEAVREIVNRAMADIEKLEKESEGETRERLYHVELAAFPITKGKAHE
jgi:uncharacterized protein (TIGR02147 family)